MRLDDTRLFISPTDLANFLVCEQKTSLDLLVAEGRLDRPHWNDPLADALRDRGIDHEKRYVDSLRSSGLTVVDLAGEPPDQRAAATVREMHAGTDVIVQAALDNDQWFGYADVLHKIDVPSSLGAWSYEAQDAKLSRETRGGTILQLCAYTDLLGEIQGLVPEHFHVVTPAGIEPYHFDDFGAFYRQTKTRLIEFLAASRGQQQPATYPEPVEHCGVCRWAARCTRQLRADDHLSFVANIGRSHRMELTGRGITTMAALAAMPVPLAFKPGRGATDTYVRLREQARLQVEQRASGQPIYELLPLEKDFGLTQLPEPRPGDVFLDLEGDMFGRPGVASEAGETAREYLFGLGRVDGDGAFRYHARWALTDAAERAAFEAVMDEITAALDADPAIHVYHYAAYEPTAFKRLAGRYATREADLDRLLRGGRFVDLYSIARHAIRAGVETYSIKSLEPLYQFTREVALDDAGHERRWVEVALETRDHTLITASRQAAVEGYNKDDCRSTLDLRRWLEALRLGRIEAGDEIARPPLDPPEPSERVLERDRRAIELRSQLIDSSLPERGSRTSEQQARYLLAYLVDWHRREERVAFGEYHRLREKPVEDLIDEPGALVGLQFVERVAAPPAGGRAKVVTDRYSYPPQENELRKGHELRLPNDDGFGKVEAVNRTAQTIDIKKIVAQTDCHPPVVISIRIITAQEQEKSIQRTAAKVIADGLDDSRGDRVVNDLLLGRPPRVLSGAFATRSGEAATDFAVRTVFALDESLLPIQGPPGSGKTFTGARMIAGLVAAGRKVGVVANGHKVIRKLLVDAAKQAGGPMPIAHKPGEDELDEPPGITVDEPASNESARAWLAASGGRVLGGTAWMWSREEFVKSVDVLFADEAGQMSLANVLAVAPAGRNLVLLGDPQQLEQPQKGSHPDGVDISALDHILGGHDTMPEDRGIFLPTTWRLGPKLCAFTSEMFYEGKLSSKPGLERQRLTGAGLSPRPWLKTDGAGLFVVPIEHDGCRNASDEEAEAVCAIVAELLQPGVSWVNEDGRVRQLTPADILVVAPYNAHVARISARLSGGDVAASGATAVQVGTVDKFQGQEGPVVIYSMATSRPEDAPRGMEFLYSRHRLNVATSRARCACILVVNPRLFEPDCKTPRQMRLANGLARYRELAV